jgi:hypothetical protein
LLLPDRRFSTPEWVGGSSGIRILERGGIVEWMMPQLRDLRRQEDVAHDLASPDPDVCSAGSPGVA